MGWYLAAVGAFTICGVVFGWEWFMNHRHSQFFIRRFGKSGTRIVFGLLGALILVLGELIAMGLFQGSE